MVRITTRYDSELKKKVFIVRGDESYARTTDTVLTLGTITTGSVEGLKIASATIDLYRTVGDGTVILYDGEEVLNQWYVQSGITQRTMNDIYLSYNVDHNLWAKFVPLDHQCLGSKSKKITVNKPIPDSLRTSFTPISYRIRITPVGNLSFNILVNIGSQTASSSVPVKLYVNGILIDTLYPSNGYVTFDDTFYTSIGESEPVRGMYTIRLEVENTSNYWGGIFEYYLSVGHQINILDYSPQFISGVTNTITASIVDWYGTITRSGSAYLCKNGSAVTSAVTPSNNGIVTFNVDGEGYSSGDYYVSYGLPSDADVSESVSISKIGIDGIYATASSEYISYGQTTDITFKLQGTNESGIPVTVNSNIGDNKTLYTNSQGKVIVNVPSTAHGDITYTATVGGFTKSITITDTQMYWIDSTHCSSNNTNDMFRVDSGSMTVQSGGIYLNSSQNKSTIYFLNQDPTLTTWRVRSTRFTLQNMSNLMKIKVYPRSSPTASIEFLPVLGSGGTVIEIIENKDDSTVTVTANGTSMGVMQTSTFDSRTSRQIEFEYSASGRVLMRNIVMKRTG